MDRSKSLPHLYHDAHPRATDNALRPTHSLDDSAVSSPDSLYFDKGKSRADSDLDYDPWTPSTAEFPKSPTSQSIPRTHSELSFREGEIEAAWMSGANPTAALAIYEEFPRRQNSVRRDIVPPNGGAQAWLQVLAAAILFMNSWGLINTYGVSQTYYKTVLLPSESNSSIAWIGSIRAFLLLGSPILYGPIFDAGFARVILGGGIVLTTLGLLAASLGDELWKLILCNGIFVGLGGGAFFLTAVAVVPTWFSSRKSLAIGIAASGSSIGGVVYPIMFYYLQPRIGYPWATRVLGFTVLATSLIPFALIKVRTPPCKPRAVVDLSLLKDFKFDIWSLAWFFGNMGLYIPFFFIEQYAARVTQTTVDLAFWTLVTINASSTLGRIIPGQVADWINDPLLVITLFTSTSTVLAFGWLAIRTSIPGLFTWCALYGFASGAFVSLSTPATVSMAPSLEGIGTRLGMFNFIGSLGLLVGNPVAGVLFERNPTHMELFCGITSAVACILVYIVWVMVYRGKR